MKLFPGTFEHGRWVHEGRAVVWQAGARWCWVEGDTVHVEASQETALMAWRATLVPPAGALEYSALCALRSGLWSALDVARGSPDMEIIRAAGESLDGWRSARAAGDGALDLRREIAVLVGEEDLTDEELIAAVREAMDSQTTTWRSLDALRTGLKTALHVKGVSDERLVELAAKWRRRVETPSPEERRSEPEEPPDHFWRQIEERNIKAQEQIAQALQKLATIAALWGSQQSETPEDDGDDGRAWKEQWTAEDLARKAAEMTQPTAFAMFLASGSSLPFGEWAAQNPDAGRKT